MTTVLIIDDDRWIAEQFARVLAEHTIEARITSDAYQAIELVDSEVPDAVVLDLFLPGSSGLALLHELQSYEDTSSLPVIICTNNVYNIDKKLLRPYGVSHILDKTTLHPIDLVHAVREAVA